MEREEVYIAIYDGLQSHCNSHQVCSDCEYSTKNVDNPCNKEKVYKQMKLFIANEPILNEKELFFSFLYNAFKKHCLEENENENVCSECSLKTVCNNYAFGSGYKTFMTEVARLLKE